MARRMTCPTFVGRESELARLEQAADAARDESQLVLVSGDAGVGKTRLIDELRVRREASGGVAVIGGCVDLGDVGVGYGPLIDVLRRLRAILGGELLDGLLRDVAPELGPLLTGVRERGEGRPGAVREQTVALLEALGELSPGMLLIVEDLHWADASTRDLIAFLARHLRTAKVALVLSYRADDLHRRHPLRPLLAELARIPAIEQLRLTGMTRSVLTMLLAGIAEQVPSDAVVDDIMVRSEGNPFYAEELLAAGAGRRGMPDTVRDAILTGIARLSPRVQAVLREAAVSGAVVDDRLLSAITGRPASEIADCLREALAQQILVMERGGCRFRHALVREAVYDELLPGERHRLHEAAGAALVAEPDLVGGPANVRWALLAYHWAAAGAQPEELTARVRAGLEAAKVGALAEAADHFERAVALWAKVPDAQAWGGLDQPELLWQAAAARCGSGSPAPAVDLLERADALLGADATPERRAELLERLGYYRWAAGDLDGSGQAREQAVVLVAGRPPSQAQAAALSGLGRHHMVLGRYVQAEPLLREAVTVAEATHAQIARCEALSALGVVLTNLGQVDDGVAAGQRALEIAGQVGTADTVSHAFVNLTGTLLADSRYDDVARVAVAGLEHATRSGMLASDGDLLTGNLAWALCLLGRWSAAMDAIDASSRIIEGAYGMDAALVAAHIALWQGRIEDAVRHADRIMAAADAGSDSEAYICAAEVAAYRGRFAEARRLAATAMDAIETTDQLYLGAATCATAVGIEADRVEAAQLAGTRGEPDVRDARAVADELVGRVRRMVERVVATGVAVLPETSCWLATAEADRARAHGDSDPDQWAAVAAQFEALMLPFPAATARFREADACLRNRGPRERAAAAARSALASAEQLGAAPLADQVRRLAQRGRLDIAEPPAASTPANDPQIALGISPREAEVLRLVGLGRTNRQIADELYISDKTASAHVTHLLRKLGVTNRIEAASIAQRLATLDNH